MLCGVNISMLMHLNYKKLSPSMKCLNIKPNFSLHLIQWFATLVNYYQIPTSQPNMAFRDRKKVCN